MKRVARHCEEIERLRSYLNTKIETVEQMELENLETHLLLEQRLRNLDFRGAGSSLGSTMGRRQVQAEV